MTSTTAKRKTPKSTLTLSFSPRTNLEVADIDLDNTTKGLENCWSPQDKSKCALSAPTELRSVCATIPAMRTSLEVKSEQISEHNDGKFGSMCEVTLDLPFSITLGMRVGAVGTGDLDLLQSSRSKRLFTDGTESEEDCRKSRGQGQMIRRECGRLRACEIKNVEKSDNQPTKASEFPSCSFGCLTHMSNIEIEAGY